MNRKKATRILGQVAGSDILRVYYSPNGSLFAAECKPSTRLPLADNMLRRSHSVEAETARAIGAAGLNDNADRTHVRIKRNMCSDRRIIGPA